MDLFGVMLMYAFAYEAILERGIIHLEIQNDELIAVVRTVRRDKEFGVQLHAVKNRTNRFTGG
jgi:hypothetical protein